MELVESTKTHLLEEIRKARVASDQLFTILKPEAMYDRPIAERHRVIFYIGHLDGFDSILLCREALGLKSPDHDLDALFQAGIDPSKPTNRLSLDEFARLHAAVTDVLWRAVDASGTTVRDYRTGVGEPGRFQFELKVYGRGGERCITCGRRLVTTHTIDLRATTFCPTCQR